MSDTVQTVRARGPLSTRLTTRIALVATLACLLNVAPAAAGVDQFGDELAFNSTCNPSYAAFSVPGGSTQHNVAAGVAWIDYFGIPFAVSPPFSIAPLFPSGSTSVYLNIPDPSTLVPGQYTLHVLLQGDGAYSGWPYYFLFTTVSDTATIDPSLPYFCLLPTFLPTVSAARAARAERAARAVRAPTAVIAARRLRRQFGRSATWFGPSRARRPRYPKVRICGRSVCVQLRAGAAWKPVSER
jgi:hypothetical protein